jgi:hypothetical protein
MALVSLAGGISKIDTQNFAYWSFASFFTLFRIKEFLDDIEEFKKVDTKDLFFKAGFFFGLFSWFFWIVAASYLNNLSLASLFLAISFIIGTVWIIISCLKHGIQRKYFIWLLTNCILIASLIYCYFLEAPSDITIIGYIYLGMLLVGFIDFIVSKSHKGLEDL